MSSTWDPDNGGKAFAPHPGRPSTRDFWRLSEILVANDRAIDVAVGDKNAEWERITRGVVDLGTLRYVATQRAMRAVREPRTRLAIEQQAMFAGLWTDGFVTGVMFQQRGGHQE